MTGVCTGKVRSTPTPKLTLRTVIVSRTPPPCRRITTPWKTWMRERLPSTTRTCTFNVSPGRKSGTSSRRDAASRVSRVFMSRLRSRLVSYKAGLGVLAPDPGISRLNGQPHDDATPASAGRIRVSTKIRTALGGPRPGLLGAPAGDGAVIAGEQDVRHVEAAPGCRLGVDRALEQPVHARGERALLRR